MSSWTVIAMPTWLDSGRVLQLSFPFSPAEKHKGWSDSVICQARFSDEMQRIEQETEPLILTEFTTLQENSMKQTQWEK